MNITSISYLGAQAVQAQAQPADPPRSVSSNSTTDKSGSTASATATTQPAGPSVGNSASAVTPNNAQQGSNPLANAAAGIGTNLDVTA